MRFKRTEICTSCAKIKNVCQTCVLDLQFGLPVQVRDAALGVKNAAPTSDMNREYFMQNMEARLKDGVDGEDGSGASMIESAAGPSGRAGQELLRKLARDSGRAGATPNYSRNKAHLCSFYAKGTCTRGDGCPFRHELPKHDKDDPMSKQNIKDRFHGVNDPVARKIMNKHQSELGLTPPDDKEVVSRPSLDSSVIVSSLSGLLTTSLTLRSSARTRPLSSSPPSPLRQQKTPSGHTLSRRPRA